MEFAVSEKVFDALGTYCVGLVAVRGVDNTRAMPAVAELLAQNIAVCEAALADKKVKESPEIVPFRDAFTKLGMNPNKFMPSIEALLTRISKKKGFPSINPLVDLGNAVSIKYMLPIGAHDLSTVDNALDVRFAEPGDDFIAFGETETEYPDANELLYVSGHQIRTRRWIWRQSEVGKITESTSTVIFPVDGFSDINLESVLQARDELAARLTKLFGCSVATGLVDANTPRFTVPF